MDRRRKAARSRHSGHLPREGLHTSWEATQFGTDATQSHDITQSHYDSCMYDHGLSSHSFHKLDFLLCIYQCSPALMETTLLINFQLLSSKLCLKEGYQVSIQNACLKQMAVPIHV